MTTLHSQSGLMDLNWKNLYLAAGTSSTAELLQLLRDLAKQHGVHALVNIGLVPVEGSFIDIDPQVWVRHIRNLAASAVFDSHGSSSVFVQELQLLLRLSLQRYATGLLLSGQIQFHYYGFLILVA